MGKMEEMFLNMLSVFTEEEQLQMIDRVTEYYFGNTYTELEDEVNALENKVDALEDKVHDLENTIEYFNESPYPVGTERW